MVIVCILTLVTLFFFIEALALSMPLLFWTPFPFESGNVSLLHLEVTLLVYYTAYTIESHLLYQCIIIVHALDFINQFC